MARRRREAPVSINKDILASVEWWRWVGDIESDQRRLEAEALAFQTADGAWPEDVIQARQALGPGVPGYTGVPIPARPMISVATLDEPFALASAQERQARIAPAIHALNEDADDQTAEVLQGLYREIERYSNASNVRSWAYQRAWWSGRGYYRVDKEYDPYGGDDYDQRICLKRILYQDTVRLDPLAQEADWSDGRKAMVGVVLSWAEYKRKYPKSKLASFDDAMLAYLAEHETLHSFVQGTTDSTRTVTIAEDWRVEVTERKKVLLDDDSSAYDDEIPEGRTPKTGSEAKSKPEEIRKVFYRCINAVEELEPWQEWDGTYIPIIPVVWRELQPCEGKRSWIGVVHNAKGSVRMTNFAASGAVEMAALEPKAPFTLDPRQIEGFEAWWQQANLRNFPYLPRHQEKDGLRFDAPQRTQVDTSRLGPNMELLKMGFEFVNRATQIHDPALGKQTPAFRSGEAIKALQSQSVESIGGGIDNLASISVYLEAKVILDLIPRVYDRPERVARILDEQNNTALVMVGAPYQPNPQTKRPQVLPYTRDEDGAVQMDPATRQNVQDPNHPARFIDLNKGRYGVEVTIGKSYKSRREEGVTEMGQIMQADPQLLPLIGPEYFKYRGEPWADKVAAILEKVREHNMPWLSQDAQGPNPQRMAQLAAENQQLHAVASKLAQEKAGKVVEQQGKLQIAALQESAETQRAREANEVKLAVAELSAKVDRLELFLEESHLVGARVHEQREAMQDRAHERAMSAVEHEAALEQADQANAHAQQQASQGQAFTLANQAMQPQNPNGQGGRV